MTLNDPNDFLTIQTHSLDVIDIALTEAKRVLGATAKRPDLTIDDVIDKKLRQRGARGKDSKRVLQQTATSAAALP